MTVVRCEWNISRFFGKDIGTYELTSFGGEHGGVTKQILDPGHYVVDVCRCRELHTLPIGIVPRVVE
jgi:hypothetical protein